MVDSQIVASSSSSSRIGVCISGSLRSFSQPCVHSTIVQNLVLPTQADVYAFLNVPDAAQIDSTHAMVSRLLQAANLKALKVTAFSVATQPLRDANGSLCDAKGYAQAAGLRECGRAMLPVGYQWIMRLRPDMAYQFRLHSLPAPAAMPRPALVIAAFVADCGCGFRLGQCVDPATLCGCISDNFAFILGAAAQQAYFSGYGEDFCRRRPLANLPRQTTPGGKGPATPPECKLGWSLATRGIPAYDLRYASRQENHPIVVRQQCAPAQWELLNRSFELRAAALRTLPPGPLDPRGRAATCAAVPGRKEAYRHLCS